MRWTPHVTVATVVENEGRFLFVEEWSNDKLVFNQPAGHVEPGETWEQAAIRETLEETGWEVVLTALLGMYVYTSKASHTTYQRLCYIAKPYTHYPERKLDAGIERAVWLSYEELMTQSTRHRSPLVAHCIKDYIAGKSYPLDFVWHQL